MNYRHYSIMFETAEVTGAYATDPQGALEQVYAEDVNGDQPEVVAVWRTDAIDKVIPQ